MLLPPLNSAALPVWLPPAAAALLLLACGLGWAGWVLRRRIQRLVRVHHRLRAARDGSARRLRAIRAQLTGGAARDDLSGMLTRAAFMDRLNRTVRRRQREPELRTALLFLNLDRFKQINETFGHHVGDQLIRAVADRLRDAVREASRDRGPEIEAAFGRMGGDEFVVLLHGLPDFDFADLLAEQVDLHLARPFQVGNRNIRVSASIGVVTSQVSFQDAVTTVRDADRAVQEAKRDGIGRTIFFDEKMKRDLHDRIALEHELALALDADGLQLHYQPIVDLQTGRATGFEALARWFHPERGPVSPGQFIPIAEDSGLILKLGPWVLRESCRQLVAWSDHSAVDPELTLSINVSPIQVAAGNFARQVRDVLAETGLAAHRLHIEITESTFMADTPTARRTLRELQQIGVSLNMDDFGTGYSSLSYLHRLPVDHIKIDRSFIGPMLEQPNLAAVVRAINDLAHNVGMSVVAEGVEDDQQVRHLQSIGCDFGQGYVFGKPAPAEEAIRMAEQPLCQPPAESHTDDDARAPVGAVRLF